MSRVIFKMSYKHINLKSTQAKNAAHVTYIATRPGVDKTITENDLKKELEKDSSENQDYASYINNRPRSHGLFGAEGVEELSSVQKELESTQSFVWRGIVSLKEEDAVNLGYCDKEKWQDLIRKQMPEVAEQMNIKITNLRWVAAVHMEKGHPHAHIMFWEKEPERTLGKVSQSVITKIRKGFTDEVMEEERFNILQEKNGMRDLLSDLAVKDIRSLVKEMKELGNEIGAYANEVNVAGVEPRFHSSYEKELASMLSELKEKIPTKGRIAYQYMPKDVKEEIDNITEYILQKDVFQASLAKGLLATENLTKLYTGKEEDIQKAKDATYADMKKRIGQVILKGAAELQKENKIMLNEDLASQAVSFIKKMEHKLDVTVEEKEVIIKIATTLKKIGCSEEEIMDKLNSWKDEQGLSINKNQIREVVSEAESSNGKLNRNDYIALKIARYTEEESLDRLLKASKEESIILEKELSKLVDKGLMKEKEGQYELTQKGIDEFLNTKRLSKEENIITKNINEGGSLSFEELLNKGDIFSSLNFKAPMEFGLNKGDLKIKELFGEENILGANEIAKKIWGNHDKDLESNYVNIEKEIDQVKSRIDKLVVEGYVKLDKSTNQYAITEEGQEALNNIESKIELSKYDTQVTLNYLEKNNGVVTQESLKDFCKDTKNLALEEELTSIQELLAGPTSQYKQFISIEDNYIDSTEEGKRLSIDISKIERYLFKTHGTLDEGQLKKDLIKQFGEDRGIVEYSKLKAVIDKAVDDGYLGKTHTGKYLLDEQIRAISKLAYRIYQEQAPINKDQLEETLIKHIPNKEADNKATYIMNRLDQLEKAGYLSRNIDGYELTEEGKDKADSILEPERVKLKGALDYLEKLGFIVKEGERYKTTERYSNYTSKLKSNEIGKESELSQKIASLVDKYRNSINVRLEEKATTRTLQDSYLKGEYDNINVDYKDVRKGLNVEDIKAKTIEGLAKILAVAGLDQEQIQQALQDWSVRTNSNISNEEIERATNKAVEVNSGNSSWGDITVISKKEWNKIFQALNVDEESIPKWMYNNYQNINTMPSMLGKLWKAIWNGLEKARLQEEAQAEYMKKNLSKQQGLENKAARKEAARKHKNSSLYNESELER